VRRHSQYAAGTAVIGRLRSGSKELAIGFAVLKDFVNGFDGFIRPPAIVGDWGIESSSFWGSFAISPPSNCEMSTDSGSINSESIPLQCECQ
jgi:hypothetical protein